MRRSKFRRPCKVLIFNGARVLVAVLFGKLWSFHSVSCGNEKDCSVWEYADTLQKCENNCNFCRVS